jgi:adenine-specific DNA-methyltransferase
VAYRYLGNKARITDWLLEIISSVVPAGSRLLDPMCGTASVSAALAANGYNVTASDQLRFPVLHAKARLLHSCEYDFGNWGGTYEGALQHLNSLEPVRGFFWQEYSDEGSPKNGCKPRKYFTGHNASKIDAVRAEISLWRAGGLSGGACDLLLHDLTMSANDVANIAGTYGYYRATWNASSLEPLELTRSPLVPKGRHRVLQGRIEDIGDDLYGDACYLDPPYTKRQYGGNYHILETLACEDFPEPVGEGGLRDWYPQSSNFCYKRRVHEAFHDAIKQINTPTLFVSYSEDGHIGPDDMIDLLSSYGLVERHVQPITRFRSNGGKAGSVQEHLYVVRRD